MNGEDSGLATLLMFAARPFAVAWTFSGFSRTSHFDKRRRRQPVRARSRSTEAGHAKGNGAGP